MKRLFLVTLLLLGISGLTFATSMLPKEVCIDNTSNGKEMTLFVGQTLSLSLEENPATGYRWTIEDFKPSVLEQLEAIFKQPAKSDPADSSGKRIFGFLAKKVGETPLKLEYQRPWSETTKPAQTFSINLKIVKAKTPSNSLPQNSASKTDQPSANSEEQAKALIEKKLNAPGTTYGEIQSLEIKAGTDATTFTFTLVKAYQDNNGNAWQDTLTGDCNLKTKKVTSQRIKHTPF
ncbi:MAG: protease inhibitor I42 family protein [Candidatus Riflebacteria bacterium]|nr:protease inhibitor I42 family protein [Candidatus Riflebacteria bacterium]